MNPTTTRLMRQRKTEVRRRLAWIPVAVVVGFALLSCSSADIWGKPIQPAASKSACAEKFMAAVTTNTANGAYACLSPSSKAAYFAKFGWMSDADMQQFLNSKTSPTASGLAMKAYPGNPVGESDGQHFLFYVAPKQTDGTVDWTVGIGFDILVDAQGRIVSIN